MDFLPENKDNGHFLILQGNSSHVCVVLKSPYIKGFVLLQLSVLSNSALFLFCNVLLGTVFPFRFFLKPRFSVLRTRSAVHSPVCSLCACELP